MPCSGLPVYYHLTDCATMLSEMSDSENMPDVAENAQISVSASKPDGISQNSHPSENRPWLFKPGQSGNPGGRPKKITRVIDKLLDEPYDKNRTYLQAFGEETLKRAIKRSDFMAKEILERVEGKVPQALTGPEGGPIQVAVVYASAESLADSEDDG